MSDPGLIAIIAQDTARFTAFNSCLSALNVPDGSAISWITGHDIPANHNIAVENLLSESELQWLLILGDDHTFHPDYLSRLLSHQKSICGGLCLTRIHPYKPVVFSGTDGAVRRRIRLETGVEGLTEVDSMGTGGMVIRRYVFEHMDKPWFEYGQMASTELSEDVYFCDKARNLGYEIFCDLDTPLGHCITGSVWPVRTEEGWSYGFTLTGGMQITMPPQEVLA